MSKKTRSAILPIACGLFYLTVLLGCNVTADDKANIVDSPSYVQTLSWAESADPKADASAAIAKKDYRLYIVAGRGEKAVGIDPVQAEALKTRCGKRYIPGSTDVLQDEKHGDMLQQAYDYASEYNQIIAKHCS